MTSIDLQAREIKALRTTYTHVARYVGADKAPTRYQEATFGAQPTANFHYRPTWEPEYELFDASRSAIKLADWYVLRDPRQYYYASRSRSKRVTSSSRRVVCSRGCPTRCAPTPARC
jgi:phenol/toluene 2-monooxygenase (NADH) P1/A1